MFSVARTENISDSDSERARNQSAFGFLDVAFQKLREIPYLPV